MIPGFTQPPQPQPPSATAASSPASAALTPAAPTPASTALPQAPATPAAAALPAPQAPAPTPASTALPQAPATPAAAVYAMMPLTPAAASAAQATNTPPAPRPRRAKNASPAGLAKPSRSPKAAWRALPLRMASGGKKAAKANTAVWAAKSERLAAEDAAKEKDRDGKMRENLAGGSVTDKLVKAGDMFSSAVIKSGNHLQSVFSQINGLGSSLGVGHASPNTMNTLNARSELAMARFGQAFVPLMEGWSRWVDEQNRNGNAKRVGQAASWLLPAAGAWGGAKAGAALGAWGGGWGALAGGAIGGVAGFWGLGGFGSGKESPEEARKRARSNKGLPQTNITTGEAAYDAVLTASMNMGVNSPEAELLRLQMDELRKITGELGEIKVAFRDMGPPAFRP